MDNKCTSNTPDSRKHGADMPRSQQESSEDSSREKVKDVENKPDPNCRPHLTRRYKVFSNVTTDLTMANPAEKDNEKESNSNLTNSTNNHNNFTLESSDSRIQQAKMVNH